MLLIEVLAVLIPKALSLVPRVRQIVLVVNRVLELSPCAGFGVQGLDSTPLFSGLGSEALGSVLGFRFHAPVLRFRFSGLGSGFSCTLSYSTRHRVQGSRFRVWGIGSVHL